MGTHRYESDPADTTVAAEGEPWQIREDLVVGDKVVEIWGPLPPRTRLENTHAERPERPVPGSVLEAPDAQEEFTRRHGAGG